MDADKIMVIFLIIIAAIFTDGVLFVQTGGRALVNQPIVAIMRISRVCYHVDEVWAY